MEVYILDRALRRFEVVDQFESLIWTERWRALGDFELRLRSTSENRGRFIAGSTRIIVNNTERVMVVEEVEDSVEDDGQEMMVVKGRSLESILEDRVVKYSMSNLTTEPFWVLEGTPREIINEMFDHIVRNGSLNLNDKLPFLSITISNPVEMEIDEPEIVWRQEPDTLYNAIREICVRYDLGFKFRISVDNSQFIFVVYYGKDRTTRQTENPVVFSTDRDNLKNSTEFVSTQNYKTTALGFTDTLHTEVARNSDLIMADGFERRVLLVTPSDDPDDPNPASSLNQAAREALQMHRNVSIFEGEVSNHGEYRYGFDYDLGDLVEMRNKDGVISYKLVTEQIRVEDAEGERSYPTLSQGMFDAPNTWRHWAGSAGAWFNMGGDETWADM